MKGTFTGCGIKRGCEYTGEIGLVRIKLVVCPRSKHHIRYWVALWPLTATTEQDAGLVPTVMVAAETDVDRHRDRPETVKQRLGVVLVHVLPVLRNLRVPPKLAEVFWVDAAAMSVQARPDPPGNRSVRFEAPAIHAQRLAAWLPEAPSFKARIAVPQ